MRQIDNDGLRRGGEQGSALIMVVLVLLAISAMATGMLVTSQSDHLIAANERDSERALFAAKAGLHYGYDLFEDSLITPNSAGAAFNSFAAPVSTALEGAEFSGEIFSSATTAGQLYTIESTGTYNRASRTTELVFQVIPDSLLFGYVGFDAITLHNHSGLAGPSFLVESTIFSNGSVSVPDDLTLDGAIVANGQVSIGSGSIIKRGVYANEISNDGTIEGDAVLVTSVVKIPSSEPSFDRQDAFGEKYDWFDGNSSPGSLGGGGVLLGTESSYTIQDGDVFDTEIIRTDGTMVLDPTINVTKFVSPPTIDYAAMKAEADLNDPTYFTSADDMYAYFATKKVNEVIGGYAVTTIKVGTAIAPELIYLDDDFDLVLDPTAGSDSGNTLKAHGFELEGGIYVSGSFTVEEASFLLPPDDYLPAPPDYYSFKINAMDYCYPAVISYEQPSSAGPPENWTPDETPVIGGAGSINLSSGSPNGGFMYFGGMLYSGGDIHLHHTESAIELIRLIGAELAYKIHNCDYLAFTYDPRIRCTRFLGNTEGTPGVVSYREIR